nr:MFS-type transporter clz9-like isoform X1 [Hydra vulgaris]XP_047122521.1 MFS-type transporter clz9-like isoform X1 [Hydra vulgaris]
MDETGFHNDPGKKKLIFRRSSRYPELIRNTTKICYTVVFCGNASGKLIPPFFIVKGKHSWSDWLFNAPEGSRMATSCSGWMEIQIFEEWLLNHFVPNIINKEGKKILICDNLSAHISLKALNICENLLQPLDVGYFSSLKADWRSVLNQWRKTSRGKKVNNLPKNLFTQLIKSTLNVGKENLEHNLQAGFKATGIYPFVPEHVLTKLPSFTNIDIQLNIGESFRNYVDDIHLNYEVSKKFKLPIIAGKSVSATEVKHTIRKETIKKKSQDNIRAKKRGRPLGSNNMVMKINKKLNLIYKYLQSSSIVNVNQVIEDNEQVLPVSQNDAVFSLEQINNHNVHVFLDHDYFVKELVVTQD